LLHFIVDNWLNHVLNFLVSLILVGHDAFHIVKKHLPDFILIFNFTITLFFITIWWLVGFIYLFFFIVEVNWYDKLSLLFLVFFVRFLVITSTLFLCLVEFITLTFFIVILLSLCFLITILMTILMFFMRGILLSLLIF